MIVFYRILSDSKSSLVSRNLLSILADLNDIVVWMVYTRSLISKSSSPCISSLLIIPSAPIPMVSPSLSWFIVFVYSETWSPRFFSVLPCGQRKRQSSQFGKLSFFFFLLTITKSRRLIENRWSISILKSQRVIWKRH